MRKSLASRLIGLAVLYCLVFCVVVILQFSYMGNFSLIAGAMTIRGRYLQEPAENEKQPVTGGIRIFYGGLDFNLQEERGKGLMLETNGDIQPVNPDFMLLTENTARFFLPDGTVLIFNSLDSSRGPELQISADFAQNTSEITIPITTRRSSLVRDAGQLGIMYGGLRYVFSSLGQELEKRSITLTKDNTFIAYRSRGRQRAFDPADYIIANVENYENILRSWQDTNFTQWNQNAASMRNEDEIIAFLSQAVGRGSYTAAASAIPGNFINSPGQSYRSSVFTGGMSNAYNSFITSENERMNLITRLIEQKSLDILKEEHILDYLFLTSNINFANEVINIISNAKPEMLLPDHAAGLLEFFYDIRHWRSAAYSGTNNPIEHLTEQIFLLISESLILDTISGTVFASNSGDMNLEYTARLGKALIYWAEAAQNIEWAAIGKSLVLSAISNGNAGRLHNILKPAIHYPRAIWLTDDGHWAWTASESVSVTNIDSNLNIAVSFPANMTHHIIIRGVRPFIRLQIHGMDWRSDSQFEIYDSSGWIYYPDEQILIFKLRHRAATENIRIIYREAPPPPPPVEEEDDEEEEEPNLYSWW